MFDENASEAAPPGFVTIADDPGFVGKELKMKTFAIGILAAACLAAALPAAAETSAVKQGQAGSTVVRKNGPDRTVIAGHHDGKTVRIVKFRHHRHLARHLAPRPQARS